jgi:outer membrane biogenesis lipoprotein LolB
MDGFARMRLFAALLTFCWLSACAMTPSTPQADQAEYDDGWRSHQAILDADAIMQGMARAREQASQMARSSR